MQRIEIQRAVLRDDDLAIDHAPGRETIEQGVVPFGKVAVERLQVPALNVDVISRSKDDGLKPVPLKLEEQAVSGGDVVD